MEGNYELKFIRITIVLVLATLIGGCSGIGDIEKNTETQTEVPETIAATDEYTRSFLVSTDEVSEGHYAFRPWTEAYTMWIPINATLDSVFYEKRENHWERFMYAWEEKDENISYLLYGKFEDRLDSEEFGLKHLARFAKYEGDFERFEEKGNIYYHALRIVEVGENKIPAYIYLGFIKQKESGKSLGIQYEYHCSDWTTNCDTDTERIKNHFWELVKSVKFED